MKSPVPAPDQSVFDSRAFSAKKKTPGGSRPQCPSPPLKTPPVSRIFTDTPLITPTAKVINTPGTLSQEIEDSYHTPGLTLFQEKFQDLGEIGSGSFGHVYKALSRDNGRLYAIKKSTHQFRGTKDRQRALNEFWFAAQLPHHPHVLEYTNAWEEHGFLYIQTELCEEGSLKDILEKRVTPLPEETVWNYLLDMVLGLKHIHMHNLLHLDIKPANLYVSREGYLKIGDFGLVQHLGESMDDMEGDSRYMPLELLEENASSFAADIYCLGATCFEMATNVEMPSNGSTWHELRNGNVGRHMPKSSDDLRAIVSAMMDPEPAARPSPDQILTHWKLQQVLSSRIYLDAVPIYNQAVKLTSSPPIPDISSLSETSVFPKTPISHTPFLPSPVGTVSPLSYHRPPSSSLSRSSAHNTSTEESSDGDDILDDGEEEEFIVQPRNLSSLFTSAREKHRRESLEGTFETELVVPRNPSAPITPKNLLDIFNSTDDDDTMMDD